MRNNDAGLAPPSRPTPVGNVPGPSLNGAAGRSDEASPGLPGASDPRMIMLRGTLLALVRRDGRDLTARQLTAFLTTYMDEATHTVSSLADLLHISRPGVTRIMDRLIEFDLVARAEDREDRRRVLVLRTPAGHAFFRELATITRSIPAEHRRAAA